jgi:hypothetical protein
MKSLICKSTLHESIYIVEGSSFREIWSICLQCFTNSKFVVISSPFRRCDRYIFAWDFSHDLQIPHVLRSFLGNIPNMSALLCQHIPLHCKIPLRDGRRDKLTDCQILIYRYVNTMTRFQYTSSDQQKKSTVVSRIKQNNNNSAVEASREGLVHIHCESIRDLYTFAHILGKYWPIFKSFPTLI